MCILLLQKIAFSLKNTINMVTAVFNYNNILKQILTLPIYEMGLF
jgi:hypothetical protein